MGCARRDSGSSCSWLYQRVFFGTVTNPKNEKLHDLTPREVLTFAPLLVMAFWIGLYPKPFFQILQQPVNQLVLTVRPDYPGISGPVNASVRPSDTEHGRRRSSARCQPCQGDEISACVTILHRHRLSAVASHPHAHRVCAGHFAHRFDDSAGGGSSTNR